MSEKRFNQACRQFEMPDVPPHKNLRRRVGAAFVSGCLALSMCPALALAAPGGDAGQDQGGQNGPMPTEVQFGNFGNGDDQQFGGDFGGQFGGQSTAMLQGQAPDQGNGQQPGEPPADNGQAPEGQPGQAPDQYGQFGQNGQPGQAPGQNQQGEPGMPMSDDAFASTVRQLLSDAYGISAGLPHAGSVPDGASGPNAPGAPEDAPEIPEGQVNVQQVIDTARDILREYSAADLSTKLDDADFVAALRTYARAATEQRLALFASHARPSMEAPSDLPSDEAPDASSDAARPDAPTDGNVPGNFDLDENVMSQVIDLIMDVYGYVA